MAGRKMTTGDPGCEVANESIGMWERMEILVQQDAGVMGCNVGVSGESESAMKLAGVEWRDTDPLNKCTGNYTGT
jgi:hypothetical protein